LWDNRGVKRRRVIFVALVCAAVAIVMALVWPGEKEPVYQGRNLSWWVMGVRDLSEGPAERAERVKALHKIGTNALPFLVKCISAASDPGPDEVDNAIRKVNGRAGLTWIEIRYRKNERCKDAVCAFRILGSRARPAIPELIALAHSTNAAVASAAGESLAAIRTFDYQGPILPR
jgi:hypothetical protein